MVDAQLSILQGAQTYVTEIFNRKVDARFMFHNLQHTQQVVRAAEEMAVHYRLNEEDRNVLLLAAWFHDTGFSTGRAEDHEKESVRLATQYLQSVQAAPELIQRVSSCIQATRMPQSPISIVEKIMCDADLWHLGTDDFKAMNDKLRTEQEAYFKKPFSKKEWRQRNIEFLENHHYFTDYAQHRLDSKKQEWLRQLHKKQGGKEIIPSPKTEISPYVFNDAEVKPPTPAEDKAAKAAMKETERGIQTVFRNTSQSHLELSTMADNKANIMISVNAIIISILFSVLLGRLEYYPHLAIPTLLLALVSLGAIIFAVLATRPSVTGGTFSEDDIRNKKANLLFFGNFYKMGLDEYNWGMNELLKDRDFMYSSMIKDIYFLGVVLAKKYRYLRISYTIFMFGLILSVIAFGVATYLAS